jgi:hypothetical protein
MVGTVEGASALQPGLLEELEIELLFDTENVSPQAADLYPYS